MSKVSGESARATKKLDTSLNWLMRVFSGRENLQYHVSVPLGVWIRYFASLNIHILLKIDDTSWLPVRFNERQINFIQTTTGRMNTRGKKTHRHTHKFRREFLIIDYNVNLGRSGGWGVWSIPLTYHCRGRGWRWVWNLISMREPTHFVETID